MKPHEKIVGFTQQAIIKHPFSFCSAKRADFFHTKIPCHTHNRACFEKSVWNIIKNPPLGKGHSQFSKNNLFL
jgi:hypothetical protein